MGLSANDIASVVQEIGPALTGGWVQKIFQPAPRAITLEIRSPGQTLALHLSADPETARLHLLTQRYPNPVSPPPFCQFLRAHLQGARIERMEQVPGDRIVRLRFTAHGGPCEFIAELTGRRATLLLLDGKGAIMAALNEPRARIGQAYQPPPLPKEHHQTLDVPIHIADTLLTGFPISSAIEQQYHTREADLAARRVQQARVTDLKKRLKKSLRRIDALQADLEKALRYREYARYGELLKTNFHLIHKGQDRIAVVDYFDQALPELSIPLDQSKSPQSNMESYFKKYRKYIVSQRELIPRIDAEALQADAFRAELAAIERGEWQPSSSFPSPRYGRQVAQSTAISGKERTKVKGSRSRSGPFRRFTSADGLPIYVGRNAHENESLTFSEARPDDLWLHAHGTPGSHVVVRLERGADPPPETLRDAATLALLYSDLKKSGKGEVIYARKKHVRKVKAKSPGTVTVTQEKTVFVTLDRARLDRLKNSPGEGSP